MNILIFFHVLEYLCLHAAVSVVRLRERWREGASAQQITAFRYRSTTVISVKRAPRSARR
jgi:hypothetical protein